MPRSPKLRMTPQRQIILEELRNMKSHPSADEVYEVVRKRQPHISLGTIYRNLETLSECGIIQKIEIAGSQRRFDSCTENHYHVRCTVCGRIDDIMTDPLNGIEKTLQGMSDYEITGHRLEFIGRCPDCRNRETSDSEGNPQKRRKEQQGWA